MTSDLLVTAVRQGLLFAHLVVFAFAIVTVLREDVAILRARRISTRHLRESAQFVALLLVMLWITGVALLLLDVGLDFAALASRPKLFTKLTVVVVLTINGVLLHYIAFPMMTTPQASPRRSSAICTVLGAVSTVSWLYASFVGASRVIAPALSHGGFLALYALALAGALAVGFLVVRPRLKRMMFVAAQMEAAQFPLSATMGSFDFKASPVDERYARELAVGDFIGRKENVLIVGATGSGKTHLAVALGMAAVAQRGLVVRFHSAAELVQLLERETVENQVGRLAASLRRVHLLIVDELGYAPLSPMGAAALFRLFGKLHGHTSLVVTSHIGCEDWGQIFGDGKMSSALVDRFTEACHVLQTGDTSARPHRLAARPATPERDAANDADGADTGFGAGGMNSLWDVFKRWRALSGRPASFMGMGAPSLAATPPLSRGFMPSFVQPFVSSFTSAYAGPAFSASSVDLNQPVSPARLPSHRR